MSAYAELSAAVHEPMREWWRRTGSWLLLALAVCWACDLALTEYWQAAHSSAVCASTDFRLIVGLGWVFWGAAYLLAVPTIWLIAVSKVVRTAEEALTERDPLSPATSPSLFLLCALQLIPPVLLVTALRILGNIYFAARLRGPYWLAETMHHVPSSFTYELSSVPLLLVALAIFLLTQKRFYSFVLVGVGLVERLIEVASHYHNHREPHLWFAKFLFEMAVGMAFTYALFYAYHERKKEDWAATYWFIVGAFAVTPPLWLWLGGNNNPLALAGKYFISGVAYLARSHGTIGNWLSDWMQASSMAQGGSILQYVAPVIPFVWKVAWQVGLIYWLWWLLGAPWRRQKATVVGLETRSSAT